MKPQVAARLYFLFALSLLAVAWKLSLSLELQRREHQKLLDEKWRATDE